jgi:tRNA-dihydrouridine synthase 2
METGMLAIPKLCLAPMVRVGTLPFRLLALRHGADFVYTEEIIDKKLLGAERIVNNELGTIDFVHAKDRTVVLRITEEEKSRLVCQIGTNNPETVVKAAQIVQNDVYSIDINMGCPEYFSIHAGMGAGLLRLPEKAHEIMKALCENVSVPVSWKIRLLPKLDNTLKFVKLMQSTGINHLSMHGRIREEMSRGYAHWSAIKEAVNDPEITIPINANGDWFTVRDAVEIKAYTNCAGILIARGACNDPTIFESIKEHWANLDPNDLDVSLTYIINLVSDRNKFIWWT